MARTAGSGEAGGAPSLALPGVLLGLGLGGFVDGIVLHQVLQWHHMVSGTERYGGSSLDHLRANVVADGAFHAVTWVFVAAGVVALWRVVARGPRRRTGRSLLGWALLGWGVFNVVEGVIDHHLLAVHRVRPDAANPMVWDLGYLALGAVLIAGGWLVQRSDRGRHADGTAVPGLRSGPPAR